MSTACLTDYVRSTHDDLQARLASARLMHGTRRDPRQQRHRIDSFLGATCRHLHAVGDVLLPAYARVPDGKALCRDYTAGVKRLEVLLYHVNAHEYGSSLDAPFSWPGLWAAVAEAMDAQRHHEEELARALTETLDDEALEDLVGRIRGVEPVEPTRPHPHQPHGGVLGRVSRRLMRTTDAFWDTAQGRIVPEPVRAPRKEPGLFGQYLLASPRFGREEERPQ
jgi:hypothetical protein